jgi:hypothetical protein
MLEFTLKNRREPYFPVPKVPTIPPPYNYQQQSTGGSSWAEVLRRDKIIKKLAKDCGFTPGQVVVPVHVDDVDKHGDCTVVGIAHTYTQYGKDVEWPQNDNPMILTLKTKDNGVLFATVNYVKAK